MLVRGSPDWADFAQEMGCNGSMLFPLGGEQPLMTGRKGMQMRGAGPVSAPAWGLLPAVVAVAAVVVTGCTMCPDPHDYSGPVPNGSPPQNDFRARSNGILPIGGSPHPWPTIVKASPDEPRGRSKPASIAKGEVKQLSAVKPLAAAEPDVTEESAEAAGATVGQNNENSLLVPTRSTLAVIGEADEGVEDAAGEEITAVLPNPETAEVNRDGAGPVSDADAPAPAPLPVAPLPDTSDEPPAAEEPSVADAAAVPERLPGTGPERPRAEAVVPEPVAIDTSPPRPVLRETPGWRSRRSLHPAAVYGR